MPPILPTVIQGVPKKRRPLLLIGVLCLVAIVPLTGIAGGTVAQTTTTATCQLASPAFCDTFDAPFPVVSRTGQLDPSSWTTAHVNTGVNTDHGSYDQWAAVNAMHCKTPTAGVMPPNDYFMCGPEAGESMHFMDALNDDSQYIYNSERILQPFDFTGRTGTIAFDVDAKTSGGHGWWIEVWITPDPVPGPHDDPGHVENMQNGIGLFFQDDCLNRGGQPNPGQEGSDMVAMSRIQIARNGIDTMVGNTSAPGSTLTSKMCAMTMPDMKNHVEVRLSQNHLEVWMSDPMTDPANQNPSSYNFRQVTSADGLNLNFTRGFVHFQDSHYDAAKAFNCACVDENITYHWDNIGFDGPVLPKPRKFSVPDATAPGDATHVSLGYRFLASVDNGPLPIPAVDLTGAGSATLTFNAYNVAALNYRLNGGAWHAVPNSIPGNWDAMAVPVNLAELHGGNNAVDFQSVDGARHVVANVDLLLSGAGGSVPTSTPLPTSTTVPPTGTPVPATPTSVPATATALPTTAPTVTPTVTPSTFVCAIDVYDSGQVRRQQMADSFCVKP